MQVWIGFKQNEEYVHEWTGEVAGEGDVGKAMVAASLVCPLVVCAVTGRKSS